MAASRKSSASQRPIPCSACPLSRLPGFRPFSEAELALVEHFKSGEMHLEAGAPIVGEGADSPHLFTVLSGWAFRFKTLPDGRRQVLNYALPGDFIGLQTSLFDAMDHGVEALGPAVLCIFPRDRLWEVYKKAPSLAFDVTWLAARQERLLDEHLVAIGRRTALERIAYLLLQLFRRARSSGLADGDTVPFPPTQQHIADTLGLSLVHTNKTLQRLRATDAIEWADKTLRVADEDRLAAIAKADEAVTTARPFI